MLRNSSQQHPVGRPLSRPRGRAGGPEATGGDRFSRPRAASRAVRARTRILPGSRLPSSSPVTSVTPCHRATSACPPALTRHADGLQHRPAWAGRRAPWGRGPAGPPPARASVAGRGAVLSDGADGEVRTPGSERRSFHPQVLEDAHGSSITAAALSTRRRDVTAAPLLGNAPTSTHAARHRACAPLGALVRRKRGSQGETGTTTPGVHSAGRAGGVGGPAGYWPLECPQRRLLAVRSP